MFLFCKVFDSTLLSAHTWGCCLKSGVTDNRLSHSILCLRHGSKRGLGHKDSLCFCHFLLLSLETVNKCQERYALDPDQCNGGRKLINFDNTSLKPFTTQSHMCKVVERRGKPMRADLESFERKVNIG